MADADIAEDRVRRMVDRVVSRRPRTKVEKWISALFLLSGAGLIFFAFPGQKLHGLDGRLLVMLFVAANIALLLLGYTLRKRRKAALLDLVIPRDRGGGRRLNQRAYMLLTAEHRTIEEADFRRGLAKAFKNIR